MGFLRRNAIRVIVYTSPVAALLYAFLIEPHWLAVREVDLADKPSLRIVLISDLHHKGDRAYLERVVQKINELAPDFVCFTGDLIEDSAYLEETLDVLKGIKLPLYGVPGNHEFWSHSRFDLVEEAFKSTGGAWLDNEVLEILDGRVTLIGVADNKIPEVPQDARGKRILLAHHPDIIEKLEGQHFDAIFSGHSHGGQVRLPFWGAIIVPPHTGKHDRGLFETPSGPHYVNPGIGTWYKRVRFLCRPEITVILL